MDSKFTFLPLAAMLMFSVTPIDVDAAQRRGEQNDARAQMMAGKVKKLREIEAIVIPRMKGTQYIGPEYDRRAQAYRLKFIRNGRVIFVDVDGRTGAILRKRR
ncbi:hypothetical protein MNBD_ALPHA04-631 [hydrothermal vent metagenome]|uniref:PepSY domain-containing protein n=1 Tax=hydrothermal vent metagenome TaxID=652676 RepID=A0A3B0RGI9_9ZZZZ